MYNISDKTFTYILNKTFELIKNNTIKKEYTKYKNGNIVTYKKSIYGKEDQAEIMIIVRRKIK